MEKPILFSAEMIKAILDVRKTQTRRIMNPQPYLEPGTMKIAIGEDVPTAYWHWKDEWWWSDIQPSLVEKCPYGKVGDMLWMRETWRTHEKYNDLAPRNLPEDAPIQYKADLSLTGSVGVYAKWRPSIFMPKWASSITLQINDVKVERLQDITLDGILAEGCPIEHRPEKCNGMGHAVYGWFEYLWDSINKKRGYGWGTNPWVWAIKFSLICQDTSGDIRK
jgi:hypothetical protein